MECMRSVDGRRRVIFGRCPARDGVKAGSGSQDSTRSSRRKPRHGVIGLDTVLPTDRPPDKTLIHLAWTAMVGDLHAADRTRHLARDRLGARETIDSPRSRWFLRATALSGVGRGRRARMRRIVTEVGRQPWIATDVMRTSDAVTQANGIWVTFTVVLVLYALLGATLVIVLLTMSRRWREADGQEPAVPYGPDPPARGPHREHGMSQADAVAAILWIGATLYAVFGGADFGAGLWDLSRAAESGGTGRVS